MTDINNIDGGDPLRPAGQPAEHGIVFNRELVERNAPLRLRQLPHWVCWKYVVRDGNPTKCPVNPKTGGFAKVTDPSTWTSFSEAIAAAESLPGMAGVGFVFTTDGPHCGVDLDDAVDPVSGQPKPWAAEIIKILGSYTETSPSGMGIKVFLEAKKPGSRCRKRYHDGEVEIYDSDRYFTVTGHRLECSDADVQPRQEALVEVYNRVFGENHSPPTPSGHSSSPVGDGPGSLSDDEILGLARSACKSGVKFSSLWSGHWNEHFKSQSEADSSVVFTLAFYTKDAVQIDRLVRSSGLRRDKWDERHGQQTYGQTTIANALAKVVKQYQPRRRRNPNPAAAENSTALPLTRAETVSATEGRVVLSTTRTLPTAEAFLRSFYDHVDGRTLQYYAKLPMVWRHNRYVEVEEGALQKQLLTWMHSAFEMESDKRASEDVLHPFPANPQTVKAALDSVKMLAHLQADMNSPSWLDGRSDPPAIEILPCLSSLLHLPTMRHLPPTPLFFAVNALDYDPAPDAAAPEQWMNFLGQLFDDDVDAIELLQDWCGYCLTGDTSQHKILLLIGPKRSGKGTIARVLTRLVGVGNVCGPTTGSLAGPFGLQPLVGKSLAIVSDARFAGKDIQTVVERLLCISGEDSITIDRKHTSSVTMKLPTRFMLLTNELPRLSDASGALASRFMMLRLTQSFYGNEDRTLTDRLIAELPGILNWAIQGWRRLRERGRFVQPASVADAVHDLEDYLSPVGAFVRQRCEVGARHRESVDDLYAAWRDWCELDGRTNIPTKQMFGRDLAAAFPEVKTRVGSGNLRFYQGLQLKGAGDGA